MTTGADEHVLTRASLALLGVAQSLHDEVRSAGAACDAVRGAAPSPLARAACASADDALGPLLRQLRDTAQVLSDDAARQRARFQQAGGR